MRRNRRREDDRPPRPLLAYLPRERLRAEKGSGEVDVVGAAPGLGRHVDGGGAVDDAGEADEVGDGAEDFEGVGQGGGDFRVRPHVQGLRYYFSGWEFLVERFYGGEGGVGVEVPEGEARGAVFEEGGGGFEGEGAGAAGYWGVLGGVYEGVEGGEGGKEGEGGWRVGGTY